MPDDPTCPICKTKAKPLDDVGDYTGFECVNHGRFRAAGTIFATRAGEPRPKWEVALKRAKARQPGAWAPTIIDDDFL